MSYFCNGPCLIRELLLLFFFSSSSTILNTFSQVSRPGPRPLDLRSGRVPRVDRGPFCTGTTGGEGKTRIETLGGKKGGFRVEVTSGLEVPGTTGTPVTTTSVYGNKQRYKGPGPCHGPCHPGLVTYRLGRPHLLTFTKVCNRIHSNHL